MRKPAVGIIGGGTVEVGCAHRSVGSGREAGAPERRAGRANKSAGGSGDRTPLTHRGAFLADLDTSGKQSLVRK